MVKKIDVLSLGREVLNIESQALISLLNSLDQSFEQAVDILFKCEGKVVVVGLGKSGQIGKKIAATFASTGTPSFFLHASEGIHGDLGMVGDEDVVLALSYSGETDEVLKVLSIIKRKNLPIISITGKSLSTLAKVSEVALALNIDKEACPLGLAPTTSTTATLALGDALAVCLLKKRGFNEEDFAFLHPGGSLGKKLLLKIEDIMHIGEEMPFVFEYTNMREALMEITAKRFGCTGVINSRNELVGIITDGDLRRCLEKNPHFLSERASSVMTPKPQMIGRFSLASQALHVMEKNKITSLFVADEKNSNQAAGIIHMHDLIRAKII